MNVNALFDDEPMQQGTDVATIERRASAELGTLVVSAQALVVETPEQAVTAAEFRGHVVARRKRIEEWFNGTEANPGPVTLAHRAWKALTTRRGSVLDQYERAEGIINNKLSAFRLHEQAARRVAEQLAAAAARKAAEDKQIEAAAKAEARGDTQTAEKILQAPPPPVVVPEVVVPKPTKLDGVAFVENWDFEITDESQIPREYLTPDAKKIRAVVKALKAQTNIPGVRVFDKGSIRDVRR